MDKMIQDMILRLHTKCLAEIGNRYVNDKMNIFHQKTCRTITYEFRDTLDEDGMRVSNKKGLEIYVWPRRVFDKDRDIQPFMHIPAITICLN